MSTILNIKNYLKEEELTIILNKYIVKNNSHEKKVTYFALALFDMLETTFNFSSEERNLLKYSALLHDIGYFIDSKAHHKYTKYIILNDEVFNNLPKELKLMLAIVSSGHRKSIPYEINFCNAEIQKNLLNLIALLRVADVLDHKSILGFIFKKNDEKLNELIINLKNNCSKKILKKIFKKTILFKEIFSINIKIKLNSSAV